MRNKPHGLRNNALGGAPSKDCARTGRGDARLEVWPEVCFCLSVMKSLRAIGCAVAAAACISAAGCGPLRLDGRRSIRGTVVAVQQDAIAIKHKTGRTYRVEISRDTRIVQKSGSREGALCPGVRATVYLTASRTFTASEVNVSGDRCR